MPQLKDNRKTKEIELPVSGAKVTIYQSLLARDIEEIRENGQETSVIKIVNVILKDWNFTDDEEGKKPTAINENTIGQLELRDMMAILNESEIEDFLEEEDISQPNTKEQKQ